MRGYPRVFTCIFMDTVVFDIETQNFFTDADVGRDNFEALKISVVGAYSYGQDKYVTFEEHEMSELADLFRGAKTIVGFCSNRYDIPVVNNYFLKSGVNVNLWQKERVDLMELIEGATGHRVSLSRLAESNLGVKKDRHGSAAGQLYRDGKMDELKEYCLKDVRLTKELYDIFLTSRTFMVPNKATGEVVKVVFPKPAAALL
jgi:DEAD/DEAH box helicase domain-containing protein